MTLTEFKAWFDGYTEDMGGVPSAKQWKRIKEVVGDIDGQAVTLPIYIDRYWRPYSTSPTIPWWTTNGTLTTTVAMYAAGKNDAQEYST